MVGYGIVGGTTAIGPLRAAQLHFSGPSVWKGPERWLGGHGLVRDAPELAHDRLDRLLAAVDVDAGLREERAGVGVALVVGVDVVGEAAPLAHLAEEA